MRHIYRNNPFLIKRSFTNNGKRERKNRFTLRLSDDEIYILKQKFKASNMKDKFSFLRHLIIYGYVYDINYSELQEYNTPLAKIRNNLNQIQIAKCMNVTGSVYETDVKEADAEGMAYTNIHVVTAAVNKAVDYICNSDKTDEGILISSYGCSTKTAAYDFKFALSKTSQSNPNNAIILKSYETKEKTFR